MSSLSIRVRAVYLRRTMLCCAKRKTPGERIQITFDVGYWIRATWVFGVSIVLPTVETWLNHTLNSICYWLWIYHFSWYRITRFQCFLLVCGMEPLIFDIYCLFHYKPCRVKTSEYSYIDYINFLVYSQ